MFKPSQQPGGLMGPEYLDGLRVLSTKHLEPDYKDLHAFITFTGGQAQYPGDWQILANRALRKRLSLMYGDHRLLYKSYQEQIQQFWSIGRVLNVVYPQHSGPNRDLSNDDFVIDDKFGSIFYIKPRPFVVIEADRFLVKALMVTSSDKRYVNPKDLGSLYTCQDSEEKPNPSSRGVGFVYQRACQPGQSNPPPWKKDSQIHYGHVATFDTSTVVEYVGHIAPGSMQKFMKQAHISEDLPHIAAGSTQKAVNQARIAISSGTTVLESSPRQHGPLRRSRPYSRQRSHHRDHLDERYQSFRRDGHGLPRQHGRQRSQHKPHPDERHDGVRRDEHGSFGSK